MLTHLVIRNFAIIEHLEIPFYDGHTVLTGETGAGKSIIIDALNLLLGGRASADVIRSDEDEAVVEAIFAPAEGRLAQINARLEAEGIDAGQDLVVRRIVSRSGRNKVFINGGLSTVTTLGEVTDGLVDISGQHEHYSLFEVGQHSRMLDDFADNGPLADQMKQAWAQVADIRGQLAGIAQDLQNRLNRIDFLRFQLTEIDDAELEAGEEVELKSELDTLKHAETIVDASRQAARLCYAGNAAAAEQLSEAVGQLQTAARWAPQFGEFAERLDEARIGVEEVARELAVHTRDIDANPGRLDDVVSRLERIKRLKRKHGAADVDMILAQAGRMRRELDELENAEQRSDQLNEKLADARRRAAEIAHKLSRRRRQAAARLEDSVESELGDLNMKHTRFEVSFEPADLPEVADMEPADDQDDAAVTLGPGGCDRVEFLLAPNAGEAPRPLAKIASGGELSRIMLAFKTVLVDRDAVETYVFDEVDTGIGGQTADVVGAKISATADAHQVLCITHLPQIASRSHHHYLVEKLLDGGRTRSRIRPLDDDERVEELARMLGGTRVSAKTRDAARELLGMA